MVYNPSKLVIVPFEVPFSRNETPGKGSLVDASVTLPFIVIDAKLFAVNAIIAIRPTVANVSFFIVLIFLLNIIIDFDFLISANRIQALKKIHKSHQYFLSFL
jgi:hypothetical protein